MHPLTYLFLAFLWAHVFVQLWLARRQVSFVSAARATVPPAFAGAVTPQEHAKAADYTVAKQRLGMLEVVYDAALILWLTLGGGIARIDAMVALLGAPPLLAGTLLLVAVFAVVALLSLPFGIYRTFSIEQRFGFNRTAPAVYVADLAKGWALGLLLGGFLATCVLWIMSSLGGSWWIGGWLAWTLFTLVLAWAWPRVFAPIFNKFTPLEDPVLRSRIDSLLGRCGFHASGVYVMDGSRRTSHGNAYFTGLGHAKRIVFFDTLVSRLTAPQIESVLAHELAHFRLRHVPQRIVVGILTSLAGFALLGWLAKQAWFYSALGVPAASDAAALILFVLAAPAFTWLFTPAAAAWSRRHEHQADVFAATHSNAGFLVEALVVLYRDNASTLTPDPIHSAFYDSHPPPADRIERLHGLMRAASASAAAP